MAINKEKTKKFQELWKMMDESLTRKEFIDNFKIVRDFVLKIREKNGQEIDNIKKLALDLFEKIKGDNVINISKSKEDLIRVASEALKEQENGMNFIRDKVRRIKEGIDGKDGKDGVDGEDGADGPQGASGEVYKAETIADMLETLKGEARLKIESILNLEERLKSLEERPRGGVMGGGVGKLALEAKFVDDETPPEVPNGVIVDFTTLNRPNPESALEVFADGQRLNLTEDYTLSGKIVTFVDAPVADTIIKFKYRI